MSLILKVEIIIEYDLVNYKIIMYVSSFYLDVFTELYYKNYLLNYKGYSRIELFAFNIELIDQR